MTTESAKYILAESGYELKIGDKVKAVTSLSQHIYTVERVTSKFAFARLNAIAKGKFPRIYDDSFQTLPKDKWRMTKYTVYKKVDSAA